MVAAVELELDFSHDLDWTFCLRYLSVRASRGVENVTDGRYVRSIQIEDARGVISIGQSGRNRLNCAITASLDRHAEVIVSRLRQLFDLDADLPAVHRTLRNGSQLARLVKEFPGIRVPGAWSPFELVVRTIVGQQVTVSAATTIMSRIVDRFGARLEGEPPITRLFPSPQVIASADMAGIGMPTKRVLAIQGVAIAISEGRLSLCAEDSSPSKERESLLAIPGIGPWTVEYFALRGFRDYDAWPETDLVLRRQLAQLDDASCDLWRPYRGYAAMQLWANASRATNKSHVTGKAG